MEPASTKRFRFRFSIRGLFGATAFVAFVLAGLRASDCDQIEKSLIITWATATVAALALARTGLLRLSRTGAICGASGSSLPAIAWYCHASRKMSTNSLILDYACPILALALLGSIAGAAAGLVAWLCSGTRRFSVTVAACAAIGLCVYGWQSVAYWHPQRTLHFKPSPLTIGLSADGEMVASDGNVVFLWETASQRRLPVQFGQYELEHRTSYGRMRFQACDAQYLVAGRWGQNDLRVFALGDGHEVASLPVPPIMVRFCRFVGDGKLVVGWLERKRDKIGVWSTRTWAGPELLYDADHAASICLSGDLKTIVTGGVDGIEINRRDGTPAQRLGCVQRAFGTPLMLSLDGRWLANFNRLTDLTTEKTVDFETVLGFSPDSKLVVSLCQRETRDWLRGLTDSIQAAPLLRRLHTNRRQFQLTATEMLSGRSVRRSLWIDGDYGQVTQAEAVGLLAIAIEENYSSDVQMWQIPNSR
jgi:hypothetical protein